MSKNVYRLLLLLLFLLFQPALAQNSGQPPQGFYPLPTPGSGNADVAATYVQLSLNATNTSERVLQVGTGLTLTDAGANNNVTVGLGPSLTYFNGTGATTQQTAVNAILGFPSIAAGDLATYNGTNWVRLGIGTPNQVLTVNGGGTAPIWSTASVSAPASQTYITATNQVAQLPNSDLATAGSGISITLGTNTATWAVDNTVLRTNAVQTASGPLTLTNGPTLSNGPSVTTAHTTGLVLKGSSFNDTITITDPAANRTINIPDPGAGANFVLDQGATTIVGQKTFTASPILSSGAVSVGGNTVTVPSATDTLVNLNSSQTLANKNLNAPVISNNAAGYTLTGAQTINFPWIVPAAGRTYTWRDVSTNADVALRDSGGAYPNGGMVYTNGNVMAATSAGSAGSVAVSQGAGPPQWTVADIRGGANGVSSFTAGDILRYVSGNSLSKLAIGAPGTFLQVNPGGTDLQYAPAASTAGGTVTSVAMTGDGVLFNSTVTGSPVTFTGTLAPSLLSQSNNTIFSNISGGSAVPTFNTAANVFKAASPLTTLGDIIYEDATPTPVRLAGNTVAVRKFLSQTGNGSISAAPAWNALVLADHQNIFINQCRLYLTASSPFADNSSSTTIRWNGTVYGNLCSFYDTTLNVWVPQAITSEKTLALSGLTANNNYDVYVNSAGTLSTVIWTNNTTPPTRGTQDGHLTKNGDATNLLVGAIRAVDATHTCDYSATRWVSNVYNKVGKVCAAADGSGTWTYNSTTIRASNGNTTDGVGRFSWITVTPSDGMVCTAMSSAAAGVSSVALSGIALDATNAMDSQAAWGLSTSFNTAPMMELIAPQTGFHFIQRTEANNPATNASTWSGASPNGTNYVHMVVWN